MNSFIIRQLNVNDIDMLQQMSIDTFIDTYAKYNTEENMQLHLQEHFNKEQLLNELNETGNYFFGVFDNNNPAGYTKLRTSENPEELAGKKHIELERIYALKKYQRMGLGYKMIGHCIEFASENNYEVLWLGVWKQNEKAFQFYKRCGFEIFGEHIFTLGSDEQIDWLMKKELSHAK